MNILYIFVKTERLTLSPSAFDRFVYPCTVCCLSFLSQETVNRNVSRLTYGISNLKLIFSDLQVQCFHYKQLQQNQQ